MHKKLLLVEDSATIQKVFELAFEKSDISVIAVNNGDDAIRMAVKVCPDLVVVDVTLPEKDGFEVAALFAAEESTKGTPVLLLAGAFVQLEEKKLKACGVKGVLVKPFEVSELIEKVESLIGKEEMPPSRAEAAGSPLPGDERWNLNDALEEDGEKVPVAKPEEAAVKAVEPETLQEPEKDEAVGFDEFDVSADDVDEPAASSVADELFTMEEATLADTDSIEEVEEFEEIGELESGGGPVFGSKAFKEEKMFGEPDEPLPLDIPLEPDASVLEEMLEKTPVKMPEETKTFAEIAKGSPMGVFEEIPEKAPLEMPKKEEPKTLAKTATAAPTGISEDILRAELKEQFASRADAIFREVMEKAVEKAMMDMTERLAAEFSAKMRDSVETIAWEVIPATAEALIREEIARIRVQAVKSTPS
ncbi:MAG: response regulator [Syntrophorhabdaceae bacterium]|nr:response regulator [Syntrophorhabdaceae bacterium]